LLPTEHIGKEILLTVVTKGYRAQMPLMVQSMPRAQINSPQSLTDITFKPEAQTIEIQVDGRVVPVGAAAQWQFSLWDPTTGELAGEHICYELKGSCLLPYDFAHPCLIIDIHLSGQMDSGKVQATEQFTKCSE
jgi:hypothetical protein